MIGQILLCALAVLGIITLMLVMVASFQPLLIALVSIFGKRRKQPTYPTAKKKLK